MNCIVIIEGRVLFILYEWWTDVSLSPEGSIVFYASLTIHIYMNLYKMGLYKFVYRSESSLYI